MISEVCRDRASGCWSCEHWGFQAYADAHTLGLMKYRSRSLFCRWKHILDWGSFRGLSKANCSFRWAGLCQECRPQTFFAPVSTSPDLQPNEGHLGTISMSSLTPRPWCNCEWLTQSEASHDDTGWCGGKCSSCPLFSRTSGHFPN